MNIQISKRAFTRGFDIVTPMGTFATKGGDFGETLVCNPSGAQVARLGLESRLSRKYNIIITGGGFYQFGRDKSRKRAWVCSGEGRSFRVSEGKKRTFDITEDTRTVAKCSKALFSNDYATTVDDESELKLVICIFLALSLSEHQSDAAVD
jgi:hypothetical protein